MKKANLKNVRLNTPLLSMILLVLLSGIACQCSGPGQDGPLKKAVIWRISGDSLATPSYLFGTVHRIDSTALFIHSTVREQLMRSDLLVFESDLSDPDYQQKALAYAMMEHDSLDGILSPGQYEALKDFFLNVFNFPLEAVKGIKPFYLASLIGALDSNDQTRSFEDELLRIAHEERKQVTGISSMEKESEILAGITLGEQAEYLMDEMENFKSGRSARMKEEMLCAYQKADLEGIYSLMIESLGSYPTVFNQMFVVRNESWLPSMTELMEDQSCFFAVGVGHLPGEKGLIRLLRKKGFKVVPVHLDFWFHSR